MYGMCIISTTCNQYCKHHCMFYCCTIHVVHVARPFRYLMFMSISFCFNSHGLHRSKCNRSEVSSVYMHTSALACAMKPHFTKPNPYQLFSMILVENSSINADINGNFIPPILTTDIRHL